VVLMSPQGRRFDQAKALELAGCEALVLVCGRYEGVDERVLGWVDEELSLGDFVLTGGEFAALAVVDAVARLVPGVLGNELSAQRESFAGEGLLEGPQYTRPPEFRGHRVPDVLLSGDHGRIAQWRREQALARTKERRPDLLGLQKA
jgi:tRNA (guanine37-N1)-methyltransferase